MGTESIGLWIGFNVFVLAMLGLDLGVFHRKAHVVSLKEATVWSGVWISIALLFNLGILYFWETLVPGSTYSNHEAALAFFTGYLIEKSLSADNIFVIALIFSYFAVPAVYQHRVLFWGILGALVMRAAMILVGAALIKEFHWIIYVFGAFLIFTGIKMGTSKNEQLDPEANPIIKLVRRLIPVTDQYHDDRFFIRQTGKWLATPLFLVLILVETTDLIFAVDSIPAIFAITQEPFLVYTSNVFAILGLRSLYFLLAGVMDKFHYLKLGLAVILTFIGVKMVLIDVFKIPTFVSLGVIGLVLVVAVSASLLRAKRLTTQVHPEEVG
ncbi:TerC family protein [Candidatus Cyanaurora vandensis]|uniref:TerC family protein n=1 Tax=Candidatus Cyanaurora vandensis TaxID=2714958 RepID=UPI00257FE497|nr:TerC family protein [Candidatus Cyanaurora vandensis]